MISGKPLIQGRDLKVHFPVHGGLFQRVTGFVKAVDGVSLDINPGELVAVVGESGCGKSTLGNSLLGLTSLSAGELELDGHKIEINKPESWNQFRKDFQIIFQDPFSSLNPRHTIREILGEPLLVHKICKSHEVDEHVASQLNRVGMSPDVMNRYPHAFSGGQRQRMGIARALGLKPKLIICDEIVSALDVSVQAQIVRLLLDLKKEMNLALLFISHDLSLVQAICERIYVMYLGRIVEQGQTSELFQNPNHPYTKALLDSIPTLELGRRPKVLPGEVPSPMNRPSGCAFRTRCPKAKDKCAKEDPLLEHKGTTEAACFFPVE